ncbi:hypothetical protein BO94DRAFT_474450, partial [Aspergillus sclerotioniger CBS 115572]
IQQALFTEEEVRLATEQHSKYLKTTKVNIYQIHFNPPLPRELNPKNIDQFYKIFHKNQYHHLNIDNHILVIISQQDLTNTLQKTNILLLTNNPQPCPQLGLGIGQLQALHGRHHVQARANVLPPTNHWWTVNLYKNSMYYTFYFSIL